MAEAEQARIFVSYSHKDRAVAGPVVQLLRLGSAVFYDADIQPGKQWRVELASRIDQAEMVVVLWCCHTAKSPYVEQELALAINREKALVPVRLCDAPVPHPVDEYQWIDMSPAVRHACEPHSGDGGSPASQLDSDAVLRRAFGIEGTERSISHLARMVSAPVMRPTWWWRVGLGALLVTIAGVLLFLFGLHSEIVATGSATLAAVGLYAVGHSLVTRIRVSRLLRRFSADPELQRAVLTVHGAVALALRGDLGRKVSRVRYL